MASAPRTTRENSSSRLRRRKPRRARTLRLESLETRTLAAVNVFAPLVGDWNGDGRDSLGLFDAQSRQFYLRDINAPGFPHRVVSAGAMSTNSQPLAGDWDGDGRDSPGWFDPATKTFTLLNQQGQIALTRTFNGNLPNDFQATAGDFDGDGRDDVALYFAQAHEVQSERQGIWQSQSFAEVGTTPLPRQLLVADFNGDQIDEIALLDITSGSILRLGQSTLITQLPDNPTNLQVVAGHWQGAGRDKLGWYETSTGIFTPWQVWDRDPLAEPLYAVPSVNVQSHVDQLTAERWTNERNSLDVDNNGRISAIDAVLALNAVNTFGPRALPEFRRTTSSEVFFDTNGDGFLSPLDVLLIINRLNSPVAPPVGNSEPQAPSPAALPQLSASEVEQLLDRAVAASASNDAIIAIVDRGGRILGVRVEDAVLANFAGDSAGLVFAIDGAVSKARTAAFFSSNGAPLTSRTVRFISQSTVTEREVNSNPNTGDYSSPVQGPGFVAPIGIGGHFPPEVLHTPPVDLFGIEHTNRDSLIHSGADSIKGTADDLTLLSRFNVDPAYIPLGQEIEAPESYGYTSGLVTSAQSRGIATLPGGLPLYRDTGDADLFGDTLIGGIGVFFPGTDGYASYEQGYVAGSGQSEAVRTNAPRSLEAEWIALAAAGGSQRAALQFGASAVIGVLGGVAPVPGLDLPFARIDLVGIKLEDVGPTPTTSNPQAGYQTILQVGNVVGRGLATDGLDQIVTPGVDNLPGTLDDVYFRDGQAAAEGWLVLPHAGGSLTAADVERMINQGVAEANLVRAAIRLQPDATNTLKPGARTRMVFAVTDLDGNVLGLYRMPDATVFSIDVAVAKARNVAYYDDPSELMAIDQVDDLHNGTIDLAAGVALTARTFRFLAEPRYPSGVDGTPPGAYSILWDTSVEGGAALPASAFDSTVGFDAFHVGRNFQGDPSSLANQNGVVFFPGSTPVYVGGSLAGGFGVSGDGVDQDDVVTFAGSIGYQTPAGLRADQYFVRGTRLPFQKFLRNPHG